MTLATLFTANITDFLSKARRVRSELNRFATVSGQLASKVKTLNASLSEQIHVTNSTTQSIKKSTDAHRAEIKELTRAEKRWQSLGATMRRTAEYGLSAALIYGTTSALRSGTNEIIDFDQALRNLQAIVDATDAEISIMGDKIVEVAARTKYSATEIADGMILLGQSGLSAAEAINTIDAVSDLAAGTLSNLATTTDLITTALRAFHIDAVESSRVADVMANAINKSKLNIDKLRIAFNYVGATAANVGLSIEETAASMMVLANNGLRASTIGTGLRQVLSKLVAPTRQIKEAFKENGFTIDEINPKVVGFQKAMENLRIVLMDDSGMVNMSKAFELFKLRGAQAAAILSKSFSDMDGSFYDMIEKAYEVGAAEKMMGIQAEGLAFKVKNLQDRLKNLAISLGDAGVTGMIMTVVDAFRNLVDILSSVVNSAIGSSIVQLGLWTTAILGVGKAFQFLFMVFKGSGLILWVSNLITVFSTLAITLGKTAAAYSILKTLVMGNFWAALITAVTSAGIVLYRLNNRTKQARIEQEQLSAQLKQTSHSLEVYMGAIKQTKGEGREYRSLLQRLKKDHPELTEVINENAESYKAILEILEKFHKVKVDESIKSQISEFELLSKELDRLKKTYDFASTKGGFQIFGKKLGVEMANSTLKEFVGNSKEGAKVFDLLSKKYSEFARDFYDSLDENQKSKAGDLVEQYLKNHGFDPEKVDSHLTEINKYFDKFEKRRKEAAEDRKKDKAYVDEITDKELSQKKQYYQMLSQMSDNDLQRIENDYESRKVKIEKWYKDELELVKKKNKDKAVVDKDYNNLKSQNDSKYQHDLAQLELDNSLRSIELFRTETMEKMEIEKRAALGNVDKIEEIKQKELQVNLKFLKEVDSAYAEFYKKTADAFGYGTKETLLAEQKRVSARVEYEKSLTNLTKEEIKKRQKAAKDDLDKSIKEVELKKLNAQKEMETEKQASLGDVSKIKQIKEKEFNIEISHLEEVEKLYREHAERIITLYGKESEEGIGARIKLAEASIALEKAVSDKTAYDIKARIKEDTANYKARLKVVQKYSDEWLQIIDEMYRIGGITEEQYFTKINEAYNKIFSNAQKAYRAGRISAEEYYSYVEKALSRNIVNEEEAAQIRVSLGKDWVSEYRKNFNEISKEKRSFFQDILDITGGFYTKATQTITHTSKGVVNTVIDVVARIREAKEETGSWGNLFYTVVRSHIKTALEATKSSLKQVGYGLRLAMEESKTWGETMISIGYQISDVISTNLTSGLFDFIDGTKSAKRAFRDFAKSTIRWLTEMIVKQQLYNAVSGFLSNVLPTPTPTLPNTFNLETMSGRKMADGGWIQEPVIGRGLISGSRYTLGEKEKELVIPASKINSSSNNSPNVKVIVNNNTGQQAQVRQEGPAWNGSEFVLSVWLDAVNRNKYGMRDLIKGVR